MRSIKKQLKQSKGFTLMELLIYVGIATVAIVVFTNFMVDVTKNASKAKITQEVQQNARLLLSRMTQEIRTAKEIIYVTSDQITFKNSSDDTITFYLNDDDVYYDINSSGPVSLINDQVRVTQLNFQQNSDSVNIDLTVEQKDENVEAAKKGEINLTSTIVPRPLLY